MPFWACCLESASPSQAALNPFLFLQPNGFRSHRDIVMLMLPTPKLPLTLGHTPTPGPAQRLAAFFWPHSPLLPLLQSLQKTSSSWVCAFLSCVPTPPRSFLECPPVASPPASAVSLLQASRRRLLASQEASCLTFWAQPLPPCRCMNHFLQPPSPTARQL